MPKYKHKHIDTHLFWDLGPQKQVHATLFRVGDDLISLDDHRIGHFAIRWIVRGRGTAYIDYRLVELKPNLLFLGNPSQISRYVIDNTEPFEVYIIAFTEPFIGKMHLGASAVEFLFDLARNFEIYPTGHSNTSLSKLFELVVFEFENGSGEMHEEIMANLVRSILQYAYKWKAIPAHNEVNRNYFNVYKGFLGALEINLRKLKTVNEYADVLQIHPKLLNRACLSMTNLQASKIIQKRTDMEAKQLLLSSDLSTKQIGYDLGFNDAAYFTNFFKRLNGMTPSSYRLNIN